MQGIGLKKMLNRGLEPRASVQVFGDLMIGPCLEKKPAVLLSNGTISSAGEMLNRTG